METNLEEDLALIGRNIHRIRKQKKMSLKELAGLVGISGPYLSQIENGKVNFNLNDLTLIGNALNVSISSFFVDSRRNMIRLIREKDFVWRSLHRDTKEAILRKSLQDFDLSVISVPMNENTGHKSSHEGAELCFVLEGELTIQLENIGDMCLQSGDSCYYKAKISHRWENTKPDTAVFLLINTL